MKQKKNPLKNAKVVVRPSPASLKIVLIILILFSMAALIALRWVHNGILEETDHLLDEAAAIEQKNEDLQQKMIKLEEDTAHYTEMTLMMAVNYGGRDELAHAARILAQKAVNGEIKPEDINEQSIADELYTKGIPDVDLVIRPSGEMRLSNYLIWQCAYAEYYFTDILWPDFTPAELDKALIEFGRRNRRFGGV